MLEQVSLLVMQSDEDAERARALGAPSHLVRTCGNLKYDLLSLPSSPDLIKEIDERFALSSSPRVIVAGSTAPGEEKILLDSLVRIRAEAGLEDTRLVIAPRHPERFEEVASLVERSGFRMARRSRVDDRVGSLSADVVLLDSIGELSLVYRFASVVFVGGSLIPRGGHNIMEPAACAKPIIVGPHTENFRQIVSDFAAGGALIQLGESGVAAVVSLAREAIRLLNDRLSAEAMGERANEILSRNRGATRCTVEAIIESMRKK